jgi:hypothetical protein
MFGMARLWYVWLHGAGRYPAGKLGDAVAQMELQLAGGFHPYILTDESRFTRFHPDGQCRVYRVRRCGEHFANACILERDRCGVARLHIGK